MTGTSSRASAAALVVLAVLLRAGTASATAQIDNALGVVDGPAFTNQVALLVGVHGTDLDVWNAFGGDAGLVDLVTVEGAAGAARFAALDAATLTRIGQVYRAHAAVLGDLENAFTWANTPALAAACSLDEARELLDLTTTAAPAPAGATTRVAVRNLLAALPANAPSRLGMAGVFGLAQIPQVDAVALENRLDVTGPELRNLLHDLDGLDADETRRLDAQVDALDPGGRAYLVAIAGVPRSGLVLRHARDVFGNNDLARIIDRGRRFALAPATLLDLLDVCVGAGFTQIAEIDNFFNAGAAGGGLAALTDAEFRRAFTAARQMRIDGAKNPNAATGGRNPAAGGAVVIAGGTRVIVTGLGARTVTWAEQDRNHSRDRHTYAHCALTAAGGHPNNFHNSFHLPFTSSAKVTDLALIALHSSSVGGAVAAIAGAPNYRTVRLRIGAVEYQVGVNVQLAGPAGAMVSIYPAGAGGPVVDLSVREMRAAIALRRAGP